MFQEPLYSPEKARAVGENRTRLSGATVHHSTTKLLPPLYILNIEEKGIVVLKAREFLLGRMKTTSAEKRLCSKTKYTIHTLSES